MPSIAAAASAAPTQRVVAACRAGRLAPARVKASRPQQETQHLQRQRRSQRLTIARGGGGGGGGQPPAEQQQSDALRLLKQFGLPILGLLAGAFMIRPVLVGLVFLERVSVTLVGVAGVVACVVAAVSLLWLAIPALASIFGMSTVVTAGVGAVVLATAAAGVLKVPALVPLLLLGSGFLALAFQAQNVLAVGGAGNDAGSNSSRSSSSSSGGQGSSASTIDVEVDEREDVHPELSQEQRERQAELRAFDELLSSRDDVKQRSGPPAG